MIILTLLFSESTVFKMFFVPLKREAGVSKLLKFEERFQKLRFRDVMVWTGSCAYKRMKNVGPERVQLPVTILEIKK